MYTTEVSFSEFQVLAITNSPFNYFIFSLICLPKFLIKELRSHLQSIISLKKNFSFENCIDQKFIILN